MLHMSAQCYEHRFGYCTNARTCFNVHFRPILAERRVLLLFVDLLVERRSEMLAVRAAHMYSLHGS